MVNIIIADDDRSVCQCLLQMLPWKELGANPPALAYNGLEVLQKMQNSPVDILISDVRMPLMDGNLLSQKVKQQFPEVDILLMSAYEDFSIAQQAIENGVRGYILKPVSREFLSQMKESIRAIITLREQRQLYKQLLAREEKTDEIFAHLDQNDADFFNGLFIELQKAVDVSTGEDLCVLLLRILSEYFEYRLGMGHLKAQNLWKGHLAQLRSLPDTRSQFQYTAEVYMQHLNRRAMESRSAHASLIARAKALIQEDYTNPDFSVSLLAENLHFSPSYLSQLFNNAVGLSPSEYLTGLRLSKGQELLKTTLLPITDIARMVGYANANYFAKVFRQKIGLSPSDYRQNQQASEWSSLPAERGALNENSEKE